MVAVSRGRADGVLEVARRRVKESRELVEVIDGKIEEILGDKREKNFGKKIENFEKIQKLAKKFEQRSSRRLRKLELKRLELEARNKNSIILLTFETNTQKSIVLNSYKKTYFWANSPLSALPLCCCRSKKPKYWIYSAPEPEDLDWLNIGYSKSHRTYRRRCSRLGVWLLVPIILTIYTRLKILELEILAKFKYSELAKICAQLINFGIISGFIFVSNKLIDFLHLLERSLNKPHYLARRSFLSAWLRFWYLYLGNMMFSLYEAYRRDLHVESFEKFFLYISNKILSFMVTTAVMTPLLTYFDWDYIQSTFWRCKIIKKFKNHPTSFGENKYLCMTQTMLQGYFERPEPSLDTKYSTVFFVMLVLAYNSYFAPLIIIPLVLATILTNALIELNLFRNRYKAPVLDTKSLSDKMFRNLILIPKMMTLNRSVVGFSKGLFDDSHWLTRGILLSNLLMVLCNFEAAFSWLRLLEAGRHLRRNQRKFRRFEECQERFRTDYWSCNPCEGRRECLLPGAGGREVDGAGGVVLGEGVEEEGERGLVEEDCTLDHNMTLN